MKILALDTAASWCAAAIYDSDCDAILAEVSENIGKGHAEVLMDYIERAVNAAGIAMSDLDRVAVNVGPGSFTGVRIGVSAARGFALALGQVAVGISAFEAIASEVAESYPERPVLVLLDAHRGEIFSQLFGIDGSAQTAPVVFSREEALAMVSAQSDGAILAGSAAPSFNAELGNIFITARTEVTAGIGTYAKLAAKREPNAAPKPLYMRGPDAKPQLGFALPRKKTGE